MAAPINGRNVILYKYDAETFENIPFACALSGDFSVSTEEKEITSQTSAWFREYRPGISEWSMSISGLMKLSNTYNYLYILDAIKNREEFLVKFVIDNGGVLGLSIVSGNVFFRNVALSAPDDALSTYTAELRGSGAFSTAGTTIAPTGVTIISGTTVQVFQTTATDGQTSIAFPGTIGLDLLYGSRGGLTIQPIGTLTGNGATWNTLTGTLTLATPAVAGELILILAQ